MNIRLCKTFSGETFAVYEVKQTRSQLGCPTWMVLCGRVDKRPIWRTLITRRRGRPYFWIDGTRFCLDDFKKAV